MLLSSYILIFALPVVLISILSFFLGSHYSYRKYLSHIKEVGCPFHHACTHYDAIETKTAVKRVLTLMLDNNVPVKDIKNIIDSTIK